MESCQCHRVWPVKVSSSAFSFGFTLERKAAKIAAFYISEAASLAFHMAKA